MKQNWLHWIGKRYYKYYKFTKESQEFGISRRVAPNILRQMQWGDWVYCIQKLWQNDKGGSIFLRFPIQTISGLTEESRGLVSDSFEVEETDPGGVLVYRECGNYITGSAFGVRATLQDVAETLETLPKERRGLLMIGCSPEAVEAMPQPWAMLYGIPFRQGFRLFDAKRFDGEYKAAIQKGSETYTRKHADDECPSPPFDPEDFIPRIYRNQFYADTPKHASIPMGGGIQEVLNYEQRPTKTMQAHRERLVQLIRQLRTIPLPYGKIRVKKSEGMVNVRWMIPGGKSERLRELASFQFDTQLLVEHPYDSTIAFLVKYSLQILQVRKEKIKEEQRVKVDAATEN